MNPNTAPDVSEGTPSDVQASMSALSPQSTAAGSGDVTLTLTGQDFSPDSVACWNPRNFLQFNFVPTTYVSATQLKVTIPATAMVTAGSLSVSIFDAHTNSFSGNALPFTVYPPPASSSTMVSVLNLNGLDISLGCDASDAVRRDGRHRSCVSELDRCYRSQDCDDCQAQFVGSQPAFLDTSARDTYLYIGYDGATNETRLTLPGLDSPLTWTLANARPGTAFFAGDLKAAPESPDTTAVTLLDPDIEPPGVGGLVIFDGSTRRPDTLSGIEQNVLAWGSSDAVLAAAENDDILYDSGFEPLFTIAVNSSGAKLLGTYQNFNPEGAPSPLRFRHRTDLQ